MRAIERAELSLEGLSVGDAFGERFFGPPHEVVQRIVAREVPAPPWTYTDDTEMALSILELLRGRGSIDQDLLASAFARRMQPGRGYGAAAYEILSGIRSGGSWKALSRACFKGMGSFGNGAAMRVGPLGGFFADAPMRVLVEQARLSAEVTHAHAEGIAGAIAVAVACAMAWQRRDAVGALGCDWIAEVNEQVPAGYTHDAIAEAVALDAETGIVDAATALGNGSGVSAPDTVPLCLWVCAHHDDFVEALWSTVAALGDRDTTCAIVGSILALKLGPTAIPKAWLAAREALALGASDRAG